MAPKVPAAYAVVLAGVAVCPAAADPAREALLDRATGYVQRFVNNFSGVVAEEQYEQKRSAPPARRTLRSDFLLARYAGSSYWHVFRDVFEVDGEPVRNRREERLVKLFVHPAPDALRRAQEIASASARYNIADIGTVNNPFLAMAILQPGYREGFRFRVRGVERSLGSDVRKVEFEEVRRPTILRQGPNLDLPGRGDLWLEEATGRVVKTELRLGQRFPVVIVTEFGFDEALGIDAPLEMRDRYPIPGQGAPGYSAGGRVRPLEDAEVTGIATYSRFRRFQVTTDTDLGDP